MSRLNRTAAALMHKHGAHAATDVTGFGILGHGRNLAKNQKEALHFEIHSLPIIRSMRQVDERVQIFSLLKGLSAETSGGLLVSINCNLSSQWFCENKHIPNFCILWPSNLINKCKTIGKYVHNEILIFANGCSNATNDWPRIFLFYGKVRLDNLNMKHTTVWPPVTAVPANLAWSVICQI